MFGKNPRIAAIHAQKQLLIAESELNRAQLAADLAAVKKSGGTLIEATRSFTAVGSAIGAVIAGIRAFSRHKGQTTAPAAKPSALRTILRGAGLVSSIWLASRERLRRGERPD